MTTGNSSASQPQRASSSVRAAAACLDARGFHLMRLCGHTKLTFVPRVSVLVEQIFGQPIKSHLAFLTNEIMTAVDDNLSFRSDQVDQVRRKRRTKP